MTVEWISRKYLTINFFNDEMTQEYFKYLNNNAVLPKRNQLRTMIEQKFSSLQTKVKEMLQKNSSKLSFSLDGWTSIAQKSFYGIQG